MDFYELPDFLSTTPKFPGATPKFPNSATPI